MLICSSSSVMTDSQSITHLLEENGVMNWSASNVVTIKPVFLHWGGSVMINYCKYLYAWLIEVHFVLQFELFYSQHFSGRKLTWLHYLCTGKNKCFAKLTLYITVNYLLKVFSNGNRLWSWNIMLHIKSTDLFCIIN